MINASRYKEIERTWLPQHEPVKVGLKIMMDGDPCVIVDTDLVKPGKGQAFTRVKYKNYKTGRVNETT